MLHGLARALLDLLLELLDLGLQARLLVGVRCLHLDVQALHLGRVDLDLFEALLVARDRLALDRILLERPFDERVDARLVQGVRKEVEDVVPRVAQREQQRRHRQLALAVDPDVDEALLVDLELEPRTTCRHEVGDEDLLLAVLGLHDVGTRRAHELRHDHALGAVDDERAPVGHEGEVTHEDLLAADLAGLLVDEAHLDRQRRRVGQILLAALFDRVVRLDVLKRLSRLPPTKGVRTEVDGECSGEIHDRRDVVDRFAESLIEEPFVGLPLDVDEMRNFENLVEARKRASTTGRLKGAQVLRPPDVSFSVGAKGRRRRYKAQPGRVAHSPVNDETFVRSFFAADLTGTGRQACGRAYLVGA